METADFWSVGIALFAAVLALISFAWQVLGERRRHKREEAQAKSAQSLSVEVDVYGEEEHVEDKIAAYGARHHWVYAYVRNTSAYPVTDVAMHGEGFATFTVRQGTPPRGNESWRIDPVSHGTLQPGECALLTGKRHVIDYGDHYDQPDITYWAHVTWTDVNGQMWFEAQNGMRTRRVPPPKTAAPGKAVNSPGATAS